MFFHVQEVIITSWTSEVDIAEKNLYVISF